ncbi:pentatricopeptide repeat-containing protein [Tanacetum coccineum]
MDMYGELGLSKCARKVFDEIVDKDLGSWNVLISVYVKCKRFEDAVGVYVRMRRDGIRADEATVVSTLSACIALRDLELGKEIHGYVRDEIGFTMIIGNALLDMYCKCGCLDVAREIFDGLLKKNVICRTSMVSGCVSCGMLDEARMLFDKSPVKDIVLWKAMINGYVQFNHVDEAMCLFQQMQSYRITPDKFTVVALLTEVEKIVNRISKEKDDILVPVYGDVDMGEHLTDRLMKIEVGDSSIHTLLSNIYGDIHKFLVGDASHPEIKDVYFSLKTLAKLSSGSSIHIGLLVDMSAGCILRTTSLVNCTSCKV